MEVVRLSAKIQEEEEDWFLDWDLKDTLRGIIKTEIINA